jgi:hypothetical protein
MSTKYAQGFGSKVSYATDTGGTPGTYNPIGQTKDIKGPDSSVGVIKLTNNDSPNNCREKAPGIMEPGTIGWDLVYSDTVYATLFGILGDGNIYFWKETFTDGSTIVAPGFLSKAPIVTKTEDESNMVTCEVELTGKPVFTAGS